MEQKESEWLFFFKEKNVLFFFTFIMKIQVLVKKKTQVFFDVKKSQLFLINALLSKTKGFVFLTSTSFKFT